MVVAQCAKTDGPTDAPITTEKPCNDKWSNCPALAEEKCYKSWVGEECPKSCGKCPGGIIFRFEHFGNNENLNQETPRLLQTPATIFTQTVAIFASENKFNLSSEKH